MLVFALLLCSLSWAGDLEKARDAQDRVTLEKLAGQYSGAQDHYQAALANSYLAEVATETGDKNKAKAAAEAGIAQARQAIELKPASAEFHRLLGTLCGQVIPANVLAGLKYGGCARDEVNRAIDLDGKSAMNYVSRGVGNYYLPPALGGGIDAAIKDFEKAIALDPKLDEAHLWLGIALRKANRNADARKELAKAAELNPARAWAKQQLAKTPEK